MKKKTLLLCILAAVILAATTIGVLIGVGVIPPNSHVHNWQSATCTLPKTCLDCGDTEGRPTGHTWTDVTCAEARTCTVCKVTEGEALGHKWMDATCTEAKTCSVCKQTDGDALGHKWDKATCTAPKTCTVCSYTQGNASGHDWANATCTDPKICKTCSITEGTAKGHDWLDATCAEPKTCKTCGATEGNAIGHNWQDATCTESERCRACGVVGSAAKGHSWTDATCTEAKTCSECGITEGNVLAHSWSDATCTAPKTCFGCGLTQGSAIGHDWSEATCTEPQVCRTCGGSGAAALGHDFEKLLSTDGYNLGSTVLHICKRCKYMEKFTVGEVDFVIEDTLPNGNGKKVKIILLGGQSNAAGCSLDAYLKQNVSAEKYAEYDNGYDNVYINYYVSGDVGSQGFVKCATRQGEQGTSFGPELGIAEKLNELYPDETFFIIKYTWSGTNLFHQWLSPSSSGNTGVLYKQFVKYVEESIRYLESKNYDVEIEGMCWMQGESDSFSTENGINYKVHLSNFIHDIRNQFAHYASPDGIAFIDACIADNPIYWVYCDLVNQSKEAVVKESPMNALIDTNAHGLTCNREPDGHPDMAHYDSLSQIKLGNLFAQELARYIN